MNRSSGIAFALLLLAALCRGDNTGQHKSGDVTRGGFYNENHEKEFGRESQPLSGEDQTRGSSGGFADSGIHSSGSSGSFGSGGSHRPGSGSSSSFGSSSNREQEYSQRPGSSGFGNGSTGSSRPSSGSSFGSSNREQEYSQRPGSSGFGSSSSSSGSHRPGSGSSSSFGSSSNREQEYSQRPGSSGFGNGSTGSSRPSSGSSSGSSNREDEYNQRPGQFGGGGSSHRPISSSSGSLGSSDREDEHNRRPGSFVGNGQSSISDREREICYGVLGCFSLLEPWKSKLRPVPAPFPPQNNSASLYYYSRPNIDQRYLIGIHPELSLGDARFDPQKPTAVIIHGFIQDGNENWMKEMKNAYLRHVDANVMIVDWGTGSRQISYLQAVGNTRLIGRMVGLFINYLVELHSANARDFHLIGHSLGAQIAAYIAKEVPGIGRLTALDPAQPGFEGFDKQVRLDKSDAEFVDVIHTNAKPFIPTFGLGMIKPVGHVDFYMNGGFDQPLCVSPSQNDLEIKSLLDLANLPVDYFARTITCDHTRAHAYFFEALNNTDSCVFWGHKASLKTVAQGVANAATQGLLSKYIALSTKCTKEDCVPVGFDTAKSGLRGSFVVTTNGKYPYCRSEPRVPMEGKSNGSVSKGELSS